MSEIEKQVRDIIVDKLCVNESEIKAEKIATVGDAIKYIEDNLNKN